METREGVKRLYKSRTERMIDGVCGGIAEFFGIDPTLVRVGMVLLVLLGGAGIIIYLAGMIIMPTNPSATPQPASPRTTTGYHRFWGILLVGLGVLLFMGNMGWDFWHHWWWFSWGTFIPVLLILAGVAFLFGGRNYVSNPATAGAEAQAAPGAEKPAGVRRLYRSKKEKKVFGVCGGIGEYLGIDPVIVRLVMVLIAFGSLGFVVLAYIIMAIVVPYEPTVHVAQ